MECNFFVGQKIVCVDDSKQILPTGEPYPYLVVQGQIYTVSEIVLWMNYFILVCVEELPCRAGWNHIRFKPLDDKKTDISIFKKLERPNKVKAPEECLE